MNLQFSDNLDKLAPALSSLQGELPHVGKDSKGYGYNYADLAATLDVLKPLLVKHGFSISQFGGDDASTDSKIVTLLLHSSGQFIKGTMNLIDIEMKGTNSAQNRGAVISYFRRYAVQAIMGMASEDSDAVTKDKAQPTRTVAAPVSTVSVAATQPVVAQVAQSTPAPAARGIFPACHTAACLHC
jgi:hypothetical protein